MSGSVDCSDVQSGPRLRFILTTLAIVAVAIVTNSFFNTGWITALLLSFSVMSLNLWFVLTRADEFLGKLVIFGLTAGAVELLADAWLVDHTKTLFYEHGEPLLVRSPVYMPVAWAVVLIQIGYIGYRLAGRFGLSAATLATGAIGGVIIPVYEHCAKGAGWWFYDDPGHMFWKTDTPYYIILGEFLLALALPSAIMMCNRRPFYWAIPIGIAMGLWIWMAYAVAVWTVG